MSYKYHKINYRVRSFLEWRLEHYPEDKRQVERYKQGLIPSVTPNYGGSGGASSELSRPVESVALRTATDRYVVELERVIYAIDHVLARANPLDKRLIDLVYFRGTHTVTGAAMVAHLSKSSAYRRINNVLVEIAAELGYVEK